MVAEPDVPDVAPRSHFRFRDYLLEIVYLRTNQRQREQIMELWREEGAIPDVAETRRRSHEAVLLVRDSADRLAGLSTVGLVRISDGRVFYAYRMFLRKRHRVPNLMVAVIFTTREFLRSFQHPAEQPAGMLHVNENPKLMRPGIRRLFERHGYRCWGTTPEGEDVWAVEFSEPRVSPASAIPWRKRLSRFVASFGLGHHRDLEFTVISGVPNPE